MILLLSRHDASRLAFVSFTSVVQRCFPDFITRNGILTVANQTIFKDGHNNERSVTDLRDAAK